MAYKDESHTQTTVWILRSLLKAVKRTAIDHNTTLKQAIEDGLKWWLLTKVRGVGGVRSAGGYVIPADLEPAMPGVIAFLTTSQPPPLEDIRQWLLKGGGQATASTPD